MLSCGLMTGGRAAGGFTGGAKIEVPDLQFRSLFRLQFRISKGVAKSDLASDCFLDLCARDEPGPFCSLPHPACVAHNDSLDVVWPQLHPASDANNCCHSMSWRLLTSPHAPHISCLAFS